MKANTKMVNKMDYGLDGITMGNYILQILIKMVNKMDYILNGIRIDGNMEKGTIKRVNRMDCGLGGIRTGILIKKKSMMVDIKLKKLFTLIIKAEKRNQKDR